MILVPYTRLHPATSRLLNRHTASHWRVRLDPDDTTAYWSLLASAWREPGDLVIVEHDVGISAEVIPGFAACPEPFCGNPYRIGRQLLTALGCARFSADLKAAEPDLLDVVGEIGGDGYPARDWRRLDMRIAKVLRGRGYRQHWHEPIVNHYRKY
jgi:hypothetical protein